MDEVYLLRLIMMPLHTPPSLAEGRLDLNSRMLPARDTVEGRVAALFSLTLARIAAPLCSLTSVSQSVQSGRSDHS